ncbi:MAG: hypothetical protein LUD12_10290 [Lachnospiraceae bacterium]|nr:hypothetical protein [Lachnospiraceae bacterium]
MKNPRFTDEAIGALRQPDIDKINCKDCLLRAKDRLDGKIKGATLSVCEVYEIKPHGILWQNDDCPYYIDDKDDD